MTDQDYRAQTREWRRENKKVERKSNPVLQTILGIPVYATFYTLSFIFRLMPLSLATKIGAMIGGMCYYILGKRRKTTLKNLEIALGLETNEAERRQIAHGAFVNIGKLIVEFLRMRSFTREEYERITSRVKDDEIQNGVESGKGVMGLSAHLGAFEYIAVASNYFSSAAGSIVGRKTKLEATTNILIQNRAARDVATILSKDAVRNIIKAFRRNECVGFVLDQNMRRSVGIFVNFFGIAASTTPTAAFLAQRLKCAVVPVFMLRTGTSGRLQLMQVPRVPLVNTGDKEKDQLVNTQRMVAVIEVFVRRFPEQWFWYHRRWRVRPPTEEGTPMAVDMPSDPEFFDYLQSVHEFADKLEPGPFTELMVSRAKSQNTLIPKCFQPVAESVETAES